MNALAAREHSFKAYAWQRRKTVDNEKIEIGEVSKMNKRPFGNSTNRVSEIGFGAWQLGNAKDWNFMSESEAIYLVHKALEFGCNFFDTAPNYGLGKSEEILGKALKGKRDQVVISSKFGHQDSGGTDFDPDQLEESVDKSLARLQTDYLDSLLLHNPPFEHLNHTSPLYEKMELLKKKGKILAYGASVDSSKEMFELINHTSSKVIEVMFNIFHQEPEKAFQAASEKNISLIIKVPLDSGWLSGKYDKNSLFTDIRSRWTPEVIQRRAEMLEEIIQVANLEQSLVHTALQFILSHPEVTTVIPGVKNIKQLEENLSASQAKMDSATVHHLKIIWENQLSKNHLPW